MTAEHASDQPHSNLALDANHLLDRVERGELDLAEHGFTDRYWAGLCGDLAAVARRPGVEHPARTVPGMTAEHTPDRFTYSDEALSIPERTVVKPRVVLRDEPYDVDEGPAVWRTEQVLSPAAVAHLRQIEAAGVALDRAQFVDEWPGISDDEYDELYT